MAASDQPLGVDHPTIVPENFDPDHTAEDDGENDEE